MGKVVLGMRWWSASERVRSSGSPACRASARASSGDRHAHDRGVFGGARGISRRRFCRRSPGVGSEGPAGTVRFEESYTGSGAQSRAIASGFDADIAVLSLGWRRQSAGEGGTGQEDVEARTRPRDDHPEPGRHRRARREPEGHQRLERPRAGRRLACSIPTRRRPAERAGTSTRSTARGCCKPARRVARLIPRPDATCWRRSRQRVVNMDSSGRQSMATFERGTGDAVVTYENELLLQRKMTGEGRSLRGAAGHAPDRGAGGGGRRLGRAAQATARWRRHFSTFLRSAEAQAILAEYGFRPLDPKRPRNPPAATRCRRGFSR